VIDIIDSASGQRYPLPRTQFRAPSILTKGAPEPERRFKMFSLMEPKAFYRDLFDFHRNFDEIFSHLIGTRPTEPDYKAYVPAVEAWTDTEAKKFYVRVALPGVNPQDVNVEVQGDKLTVAGSWKSGEAPKEGNYLHHEFSYGNFERVLTLPEGVDFDKLSAEFNQGVLEISAPMAVAALPRRIHIKPSLKKAA
jgi:HSP20 family molecular chaperone IbpA